MQRVRNRIFKKRKKSIIVKAPFQDSRWKIPICVGSMMSMDEEGGEWKDGYYILTNQGELYSFRSSNDRDPSEEHPMIINKETKFRHSNQFDIPFCFEIIFSQKNEKGESNVFFRNSAWDDFEKWCENLFEVGCRYQFDFFGKRMNEHTLYSFPYPIIEIFDVIRVRLMKNDGPPKKVFAKHGKESKIKEIKNSIVNGDSSSKFFVKQDLYDLSSTLLLFTHKNPVSIFHPYFKNIMNQFEDYVVKNENEDFLSGERKFRSFFNKEVLKQVKHLHPLVYGFIKEFFKLLEAIGIEYLENTSVSPRDLSSYFHSFFLPQKQRNSGISSNTFSPTKIPEDEVDVLSKSKEIVEDMICNFAEYFDEDSFTSSSSSSSGNEEQQQLKNSSSDDDDDTSQSSTAYFDDDEDDEEEKNDPVTSKKSPIRRKRLGMRWRSNSGTTIPKRRSITTPSQFLWRKVMKRGVEKTEQKEEEEEESTRKLEENISTSGSSGSSSSSSSGSSDDENEEQRKEEEVLEEEDEEEDVISDDGNTSPLESSYSFEYYEKMKNELMMRREKMEGMRIEMEETENKLQKALDELRIAKKKIESMEN